MTDSNLTGGFSSYLFGMSAKIANKTEVNDPQDIKDPHLGWMMGFMFLVSFLGLFALVPLRKVDASLCHSNSPGTHSAHDYSTGVHVFRL